jgi:hypothetical protein
MSFGFDNQQNTEEFDRNYSSYDAKRTLTDSEIDSLTKRQKQDSTKRIILRYRHSLRSSII